MVLIPSLVWPGPPIDAPDILLDPPIVNWVLPALDDFVWMYPADPEVIDQAFVGQAPDSLPEQRVVFHWDQDRDFLATLNIEGIGNLSATLYDAEGNPIADATSLNQLQASVPGTNTKQISVPDLPAGWYALEFGDGTFPTYFEVNLNVQHSPAVYLPLVLK